MDGYMVFKEANKDYIYSFSIMGLLFFLNEKKMQNEQFFLPQLLQLHVAPHNPCPLTHINVH
jgi:hypothetical protein